MSSFVIFTSVLMKMMSRLMDFMRAISHAMRVLMKFMSALVKIMSRLINFMSAISVAMSCLMKFTSVLMNLHITPMAEDGAHAGPLHLLAFT